MKRLIVILVVLSFSSSFTFGQKKKYPQPNVPTPATLDRTGPATTQSPQTIADQKWFEVFQDVQLQDLVREALVYNYDVREAIARVNAARANLGITKSDQYPQLGASAELISERRSRDGSVDLPAPAEQTRTWGDILLNFLTFELDFFGRNRKRTQAAKADLLATEEARLAVITTLIGDVATAYYNLRELDFELEIAKRTLQSRESSLRIIRMRQERGVSNLLDLRQAEELVFNATESIPAIERAIETQENFISLLIGKNPQTVIRGRILTEQPMPPEVPAGLPSDLLTRRPDIRSAEQDLVAASARIDVARKAYFPTISITSFLGFESAQLSSLFNPSRAVWGFAPQITQPIFTGGRIKSNIRLTEARREFLLVNYERTIQNAFREVSDALIAYRKIKEVRTERTNLVNTLRDRVRLAYLRYNGGVANLLEALDADRELFEAELSLAQARRDELLTVVQLYKALGGGWQ
jgi:outer membrane protein, multidrug efflux system